MRRVILAMLVGLAGTAAADPLDEVGLGAADAGMGGARMPFAIGADAAHADPAAVAIAARPEILVGWQDTAMQLSLDGHDAGATDAHGAALGVALPFTIAGLHLGVGAATYLPDQYLARLQLVPIGEPSFLRFQSQAQRLVVEPTVSLAIGDWAFGAGASFLSDARSRQVQFDVGVVGGTKQGNAALDVVLPLRAAPLASVRWRPARWLTVVGAFRGQLSLDLAFDIRANVNVPGVVTGDAIVSLRSVSYFTPLRATLGVAVQPREDLVITGEVSYERWSALGSGAPDLRVLLGLDIAPPLVDGTVPPARFHDLVTPRVGAEWQLGRWFARAGAGYLPSPVPAQTGITSYADGARTLATLGGGVRLPAPGALRWPIDLDLAVAWEHVAAAVVHKDAAIAPGGDYSSGGDLAQVSVSAKVRF
ncbi:MAG TPA: hypothetical protein VGM88_09635 [Kofleriaceae bacterium]|jgi:hypothetical protein